MDIPQRFAPNVPFEMAGDDFLGHADYAARLYQHLTRLPPGTVVGLRGPWGQGKTDVLARVIEVATSSKEGSKYAAVIGLNPWAFRRPEVLTPLVREMAQMVPPAKVTGRMREAAATVARAGAEFAVKSLAGKIPFGSTVFDFAKEHGAEIWEALAGRGANQELELDATFMLAAKFRDLIEEVLEARGASQQQRILVCIDDLDRCLPSHQIAVLESVHFAKALKPRVQFLLGIDPQLLREAVIAHYGTSAFDADAYLEKLVDYSQVLLPPKQDKLAGLIKSRLSQKIDEKSTLGDRIALFVDIKPSEWYLWSVATFPAELRNPRTVERTFARLQMVFYAQPFASVITLMNDCEKQHFLFGLAAVHRWPAFRLAISQDLLRVAQEQYGNGDRKVPPLPAPQWVERRFSEFPRVRSWLETQAVVESRGNQLFLSYWQHAANAFGVVDTFLQQLGL